MHIMNKFFFLPVALLLTLAACKQDPKTTADGKTIADSANTTNLAGHWVNLDFCARAQQYGSVLAAMNFAHLPYAYAFTFTPAYPDSVELFNGMEKWMLPVSIKADTIEIKGARPGKSVFLIFDSQGTKDITMFDPSPSGMHTDHFIKSKAGAKDGYTSFTTALNHNLFSGVFSPDGDKTKNPPMQFTPGGFILNFKDYDRYELCTAGDCFVVDDKTDVITFSKSKQENSNKIFGFKYSNQNDTLTFYDLINMNPAEKGSYKLGKPVYKLARKKAE